MRGIFVFTACVLLVLLSSCKKENRCDCIKRTGKIITEVRQMDGFVNVAVENDVDVFISEAPEFEVKVEAGENIVPLIKTEVTNGTLFIRNRNRCNWTRSYKKTLKVYVSMPVVKYITSDGTGDVSSLNVLTTDTMDIQTKNSGNIALTINNLLLRSHMHGSGDVTLSGSTSEHDISIGGTAYIYAESFQTVYTYVHSYSLGTSHVRANNLLICRIDEKGDIFCHGNPPTVQKEQNGKGQLYLR